MKLYSSNGSFKRFHFLETSESPIRTAGCQYPPTVPNPRGKSIGSSSTKHPAARQPDRAPNPAKLDGQADLLHTPGPDIWT
jgi:hypothetical protein